MSNLNCTDCQGYSKCILNNPVILDTEDFFSYSEVRFCPFQIMFLLSHKELLETGEWPPEYKDSESSRRINPEGRFVKPMIALAEITIRLKTTGRCGELLTTQVEDGRSFHTLSDGAREALFYCSGYRRRQLTFAQWLANKNHRKRKTPRP